jgi:hypothetical protein
VKRRRGPKQQSDELAADTKPKKEDRRKDVVRNESANGLRDLRRRRPASQAEREQAEAAEVAYRDSRACELRAEEKPCNQRRDGHEDQAGEYLDRGCNGD